MSSQNLNSVSYKMRPAKIIEFAISSCCCLLLATFSGWIALSGIGRWSLPAVSFMAIFTIFPLAGSVIFIIAIFRARLTFTKDGIFFQGMFSPKHATWDDVSGFYDSNGETYLSIQNATSTNKTGSEIPISWFSKMPHGEKFSKPDDVLTSLLNFAPHLFVSNQIT